MSSLAQSAENATGTRQSSGLIPLISRLLAWFCLAQLAAGCTYRFTNQHLAKPEGVRTIAVEAVYDTSREVLPHELLWESLQAAFASDGNLRVTPQSEADALVRAHIMSANIVPTGDISPTDANAMEEPVMPERGDAPPDPRKFPNLTKTSEYKSSVKFEGMVDVEVWNLRTHKLLLKGTYPLTGSFGAIDGETRAINHSRYDENVRVRFKETADLIAAKVVRDLMVR